MIQSFTLSACHLLGTTTTTQLLFSISKPACRIRRIVELNKRPLKIIVYFIVLYLGLCNALGTFSQIVYHRLKQKYPSFYRLNYSLLISCVSALVGCTLFLKSFQLSSNLLWSVASSHQYYRSLSPMGPPSTTQALMLSQLPLRPYQLPPRPLPAVSEVFSADAEVLLAAPVSEALRSYSEALLACFGPLQALRLLQLGAGGHWLWEQLRGSQTELGGPHRELGGPYLGGLGAGNLPGSYLHFQ